MWFYSFATIEPGEGRTHPTFMNIEKLDKFDITVTPTLTGLPSLTWTSKLTQWQKYEWTFITQDSTFAPFLILYICSFLRWSLTRFGFITSHCQL